MKSLELAKKRAEHASVENLKTRTFNYRLTKDYNAEVIRKIDDMEETRDVIIQTSRLSDKIDYKKISAPLDTDLTPGQIVYWDREATNWLIYLRRNTEKNYFLGEMREAQYRIKWRDQYGNVWSQLGSFSRQDPSVVQSIGYITTVDFQYLDGSATIMMQDNEVSRKLERYDKFKIAGVIWKVVGYDTTSYKNIILFYLEETESNPDTEKEDIPEGQIERVSAVESNLDGMLEVKTGTEIDLEIVTKLNGTFILEDSYVLKAQGAVLSDRRVSFLEEGEAIIRIESQVTGAEVVYKIKVSEDAEEFTQYMIIGPDTITTSLSYNYELKENINGSMVAVKGKWSVESSLPVKVSKLDNGISIKTNRVGDITVHCDINDERVSKKVRVKSLMDN